jgi:hypothetical protein
MGSNTVTKEQTAWLFSDAGWETEIVQSARHAFYMSEEERRVLVELNKVRSHPARYAREVIQPLFKSYDGKLLKLPGWRTVLTREGVAPARELFDHLNQMDPVPPVVPAEGMCYAAIDHVEEQMETAKVGHIGADESTPGDRIGRYGDVNGWGEAIAYGNHDGGLILLQLLIDDGVDDRGQRNTLLDPQFRVMGVAIGPHPVFGRMCDILVAGTFTGE